MFIFLSVVWFYRLGFFQIVFMSSDTCFLFFASQDSSVADNSSSPICNISILKREMLEVLFDLHGQVF